MIGLGDLVGRLRPGMRVFLHAGPSEPLAFREALAARPECAAGVHVTGVFIPGVNTFDYAALTDTTRGAGPFVAPQHRTSFSAGRFEHLPLHYSELAAWFATQRFDLAILHLPPDAGGVFSCGLNADVAAAAARAAAEVAVLVNPALPRTRGAVALARADAAVLVDGDGPLLRYPSAGEDEPSRAIARHVAAEIRDGDTIETGIGRLPGAILAALRGHRHLRMHTGMIGDEAAALVEAGAIDLESQTDGVSPILTGMALGGAAVQALAARDGVGLQGVEVTHDLRRLAGIERFVAINSAIEVDLLGQANAELIDGRQVSGIGGAADFARGARLSPGGRSIIALPASAKGKSRIVPCLPHGIVSQPRSDADIVVTEHGLARVRHLSLDARAEALIAIADPAHRSELTSAWRELRARL